MLKNLCVLAFVFFGTLAKASHLPSANVEALSYAYLPPSLEPPIDIAQVIPEELYEAPHHHLSGVLNIPRTAANVNGIYGVNAHTNRNDFIAPTIGSENYVSNNQGQQLQQQQQLNTQRNGNIKHARPVHPTELRKAPQGHQYSAVGAAHLNELETNLGRTGTNTGNGYQY